MDDHLWEVLLDAFPRLLGYGLRVTIPLTLLSFTLAIIIAVIVALIQYANIKVLRQICRFYIWAESVRGALESVSKGQVEAGQCVGMNYLQIMWHIVLPQAFRVAFPALSNSMISMTKETSLAATITVMEMFRQAQVINGRVYESLGLYTEVALIYLMFCTILTALQHFGERKLGAYGQTAPAPGFFGRLFGSRKAGGAI